MSKLIAAALSLLGLLVYVGLEMATYQNAASEQRLRIEGVLNKSAAGPNEQAKAQLRPSVTESAREFIPTTKIALPTDTKILLRLGAPVTPQPEAR